MFRQDNLPSQEGKLMVGARDGHASVPETTEGGTLGSPAEDCPIPHRPGLARILLTAAAAAVLTLAVACEEQQNGSLGVSTGSPENAASSPETPPDDDGTTSLAPTDIRIETEPTAFPGGPSNLLLGVLRYDAALGCIYLAGDDGERYHLIFPFDSRVELDPIRVVDAAGTVIGAVDEQVTFGGSSADPAPRDGGADSCGATQALHVWLG